MKEEVSSPTVSYYSLIHVLSCAIDAHERRNVITADIPGAFLQSELINDEEIFIVLRGKLATLFCKTNPAKYDPHLKYDRKKNEHYIYAKLKKSLYGTLQGALRFWEDLAHFLRKQGFERNKYDWCVMNREVEGSQKTILFHVDDLKISHRSNSVLQNTLTQLSKRYGKIKDSTVTYGKVHELIGVTFDFSEAGRLKVKMNDYVEGVLENADQLLLNKRRDQAKTPAGTDLFNIDGSVANLDLEKSDHFRTMSAKLLYLAPRGRPDIMTAVSFLCTRIQQPNVEDWEKLSRVLRYLNSTKELFLTIDIDDITQLYSYVDSAHMSHHDLKGHTGGFTSFRNGAFSAKSKKQRLNSNIPFFAIICVKIRAVSDFMVSFITILCCFYLFSHAS